MKNYLALIIILFGFISNVFAGPGGELIFHTISLNGNSTFSLRAYKGSEYAWLWDENNSKVIFVSEFDHTWNNLVPWNRGFDVPKDENDGEFGAIPWGIIHFTITSGFQIINFTLDLRDEDWCLNNSKYYTADTYVNFDFSQYAEIVFLSQGAPKDVYNPADPTQKAITSSTQEIWTFWSPGSSPYRANFTVPVTLINEVENTTYHYGLLYANGATIPTDTEAYLRLSSAQVNTHTDLIEYSGNNNYSFKWEHSNVQPTSSSSFDLYKSYTRFNSTLTIENKAVKRVFRPVYPLTIKNNLVEAGGISTDIVYFKDPTTTNTYEEKSAIGGGFIKDNAFDSLSILVGSSPNQKYGAKAKQQIIYNDKTYNYLEGDFTTTGTDFLVTAATTKTAYYKGQLLSNQTNAYSNPSQRRFIQTPDGVKHICYESMNRVWIEHSTDNGTTWYLGNGGKPLSNADSKNPSMSFYGNQIVLSGRKKAAAVLR